MEASPLHSTLGLRTLHECFPHKPGPQVLCHQQNDPRVDPDHVGIIPVLQGIEGINESVLGPCRGIFVADVLQYTQGRSWQKWQGTAGRTWHHCSINWPGRGRPAPNDISLLLGIRRCNSPEIIAVGGKLLAEFEAKAPVYLGRNCRILE